MLCQGGALGKQPLQIVHKHAQLRRAPHQHHVVDGGNGDAAVPDAPDDDLLDLLEDGLAKVGQELPVQRGAQGLPAQLAGQDAAPTPRMAEAGLSPLRQREQLPLLLGVQLRPDKAGLPAEVVGDGPVNVVAAQAVVAGDGHDLHHVGKAVHHADVQSAAAEIHNEQPPLLLRGGAAVEEGRGGGLIDEPLYRQSRQLSRQTGGAALVVVEIGGDADDGLLDPLSQGRLGALGQLPQHQSGQLVGQKALSAQGEGLFRAHPGFEGGRGLCGMGNQPLLGHGAHHHGAVLQHPHTAGRHVLPQLVGEQLRASVSIDADQRVGGAQINSDDCHRSAASFLLRRRTMEPGGY